MKCGFAVVLAVVLAGATGAHEVDLGTLTIGHPWSTITRGGLKTTAVYLTLINDGDKADTLLRVSSPIAAGAMIHMNIKDGNVMRMRMLDAVEIPAGKAVTLEPGGLHIMLTGIDHPLKAHADAGQ
jgi:copper(I)-binding protein